VQQQGSDAPEQALYVVGWAKRGPTGIIGGLHPKALSCAWTMSGHSVDLPQPHSTQR
jgi:hypothetical protein